MDFCTVPVAPRLATGGTVLVALRYTNPLHQPPVVVYDSVLCYSTANTLPYRPQVTFKGSYLGTKTPYGSHITQPLVVDHSACGSSKTVASYVLDMGMAYYCLTDQLNAHCTPVSKIWGTPQRVLDG